MGNEKLIKAMLLKIEVRAAVYVGDSAHPSGYGQGWFDAVRDLVEILYPTLDAEQRATLLMSLVHEIEVDRSATWRHPLATS